MNVMRLQSVTVSYSRLQSVTVGYSQLQLVTVSYSRLQSVAFGYSRLQSSFHCIELFFPPTFVHLVENSEI